MARSKSKSRRERDLIRIANAPLLRVSPVHIEVPVEDRRLFHPMGPVRPALSFFAPASRLVPASRPGRTAVATKVRFELPGRVALCARRGSRREVLFAKRLTRKGSGSARRNRNYWSSISCKR